MTFFLKIIRAELSQNTPPLGEIGISVLCISVCQATKQKRQRHRCALKLEAAARLVRGRRRSGSRHLHAMLIAQQQAVRGGVLQQQLRADKLEEARAWPTLSSAR
jgi:hypothetical protein